MMESRAQDAADDIGNFFQGDGTAFGGKAPMGLADIVDNGTSACKLWRTFTCNIHRFERNSNSFRWNNFTLEDSSTC